jgi:hypothetical protein
MARRVGVDVRLRCPNSEELFAAITARSPNGRPEPFSMACGLIFRLSVELLFDARTFLP